MATRKHKRVSALVFSVVGHAVIVAALTFSLPLGAPRSVVPASDPIEAVMIDGAALNAEIQRRKLEEVERETAARAAREEAERQAREEAERVAREEAERQARVEAERIARVEAERVAREEAERAVREEAERQAREQAERVAREEAERQARVEAERQAREEAERQARELAARRAAEARAARIAEQQAQAIAAEQEARRARESGVLDQWILQIQNEIEREWIRPQSATQGIVCALIVEMIPSGDVTSIRIDETECNGDEATRRSIVTAVEKASPLTTPPVRSIFEPRIRIRFAPDG